MQDIIIEFELDHRRWKVVISEYDGVGDSGRDSVGVKQLSSCYDVLLSSYSQNEF